MYGSERDNSIRGLIRCSLREKNEALGRIMAVSSLTTKDLKAILDIVHMVNDDQNEVEAFRQTLVRLGALVGCESISYIRVEHTGRMLGNVVETNDIDISYLPGFHTAFSKHPAFAAYRCGRLMPGISAALTDLADLPTLRQLMFYTDFQQPYGVNDQLLCVTPIGNQQGTVLAFNRARLGFSRRNRAIVDLVTPHLTQAVTRRRRVASLSAAVRRLGHQADQIDQAGPRLSLLTSREREVVEYLVSGITDREIARSLAISPRTVHKHLENVYSKLGIGNRTSLTSLVHLSLVGSRGDSYEP
jgi:DNA-binding CsgD family transcriptional regulator